MEMSDGQFGPGIIYRGLEQAEFEDLLDSEEFGQARTVSGWIDQDEAPVKAKPFISQLDRGYLNWW